MSTTLGLETPRLEESQPSPAARATGHKKIWVDLDNSPHVPFFRPIINELRDLGYDVFVTARDAYQVRELTAFYGVEATVLGRHYGKHKILKALGTLWRTAGLATLVLKEKPDLAISHGSRGMLLTATVLGIPSLVLVDYEFSTIVPFVKPTWLMVPSVVPEECTGLKERVIKYPGIKEDVYLSKFHPDKTLRQRLAIPSEDLLVMVRPPATEAHYHNPEADTLLTAALSRFVCEPHTTILLLPRNKRQEAELRAAWAEDIASRKIIIPLHAEDGLNLIWNSDLVISGGGTMNREAAAMGVPVYSIFRGKIGAVDHYLADQGRLVLIECVNDVKTKIRALRRKPWVEQGDNGKSPALETIIRTITSVLK